MSATYTQITSLRHSSLLTLSSSAGFITSIEKKKFL
jgi:hypothetical protein